MSKTDCWIWAILLYMVVNNIASSWIKTTLDIILITISIILYILMLNIFIFKK